jgi:ribonucleoside-diphosphate reductase alpha chain
LQISDYQHLIHQSRYARWLDDAERRETFEETVDRYLQHFKDDDTTMMFMDRVIDEGTRKAILNMDVMPSMRAMWSAGEALKRDNAAAFNCCYTVADHPRVFDETFYLLMCGCGVGYSVERQYVNKLPEVPDDIVECDTVITVADSKQGWASALRQLISLLFSGHQPTWDVSRIRPAGARLKVFGGRASGPQPLVDLFEFTVHTFRNAQGRKLSSLEVHDLLCKVGEAVVVGGVRRSAMISLSNVSDDRMRACKSGAWYDANGQRALANNSAVYDGKPDFHVFQNEMKSLYESYSGERGVFNRGGAQKKIAEYGKRDPDHDFGANPCAEILLRPQQMCNLSEVVVRPKDTLASLKKKVRIAAILGTLQATQTNFRYLRQVWQDNCEDEALLGVSLTGICDHKVMSGQEGEEKLAKWLEELRTIAEEANAEYADLFGISTSASVTTLKPSGTVSQLVDASSGIHPRYSKHYVRRIRQSTNDPLTDFLIDQGVPHEPCAMNPATTVVFDFFIESPEHSLTTEQVGTIDQLELARIYGKHWATHTVSCTAYYTDDTWFEACDWMWKNFDSLIGMSFLPHSGSSYKQAPYEEIDLAEYTQCSMCIDPIDWSKLPEYERGDTTEGAQTAACVGDKCELV